VLQKIFNKDIVLSVILKSAKNLIFEKKRSFSPRL